MKALLVATILAGLAAPTAVAQTAAPVEGSAPAPAAHVRLLAPHEGDKLEQTFVTVRYEVLTPGITGGTPNFWVQLDDREPVVTTQTEHNFTGLAPGPHTVVLQLVDANNTPIPGSRVQTRFTIAQPQGGSLRPEPPGGGARALDVTAGVPPYRENEALPSSSTALPLLSVIGFGALVGGIVSAMKTR